jgi:hypothetical protein
MIRAGICQIYSWLPLGFWVLRKIETSCMKNKERAGHRHPDADKSNQQTFVARKWAL